MTNEGRNKKRRYEKPAVTSSAPFERLALACNGTSRGQGAPPPQAVKNTPLCTIALSS